MDAGDSALDLAAVERARKLLATPRLRDRIGPVLAAAAFAAASALSLAAATIMAPPAHLEHLRRDSNGELVARR